MGKAAREDCSQQGEALAGVTALWLLKRSSQKVLVIPGFAGSWVLLVPLILRIFSTGCASAGEIRIVLYFTRCWELIAAVCFEGCCVCTADSNCVFCSTAHTTGSRGCLGAPAGTGSCGMATARHQLGAPPARDVLCRWLCDPRVW